MNDNSLAQTNAQKQIRSSWTDDPFDLKGTVIGMTIINPTRNLSNYAESLVAHFATYDVDQYKLSLDTLPEYEQNELARLYIESIDREIEYACYGLDESINSDYLCALLSMLKDDCKETRENFAAITRKNIIAYYAPTLQKILNEACDAYLHTTMNEHGYYADQDLESGDIYWRKLA